MKDKSILRSGRFNDETSGLMLDFHSSIDVDKRMAREDVSGSIAHARMLGECGILQKDDVERIIKGLECILAELDAGEIEFSREAEDIHMNIESLLTKRIGEPGKRVHTARSRNDQVALDIRMYLKGGIKKIQRHILAVQKTLIATAGENLETIMPGYTHMQKAQPITLAHHVMAYFEMFKRDYTRLEDCTSRMDEMPLGSGALATSTYKLDRAMVADELGFSAVTANSLDSVSDRDFCIEFLAACSIIMMHLSRFCEELIIWCSEEFGFIEMSDSYATGSSIMPQKKNPDAAELIRGKTGRVYGALMALLTVMKGLPLAYNKDMQEDKEQVFDALDTVCACLNVFERMFGTISFKKDKMLAGAGRGFTNATDAADYLVKKGLPFRSAHEIVGKLVLYCIQKGKAIDELELEELTSLSTAFESDVYENVSLFACVNNRNIEGGPATESVLAHIKKAREFIDQAQS